MSDPVRWLEDAESPLGPHERDALRAIAIAGPASEQRARVLERLERLTGAPRTPAASAWRWSLIAGALAIALVGTNAYVRTAAPSAAVPALAARPAPPVAHAREATPREGPTAAAPGPEAPRSMRAPARRVRVAASAANDPAGELTLLTPARQVLAVNPARALALADEHSHRYPRGAFREERAFLRIEALMRMGRRAAAERAAHAFLRAHPGSPYQQRLQQLLAAAR